MVVQAARSRQRKFVSQAGEEKAKGEGLKAKVTLSARFRR